MIKLASSSFSFTGRGGICFIISGMSFRLQEMVYLSMHWNSKTSRITVKAKTGKHHQVLFSTIFKLTHIKANISVEGDKNCSFKISCLAYSTSIYFINRSVKRFQWLGIFQVKYESGKFLPNLENHFTYVFNYNAQVMVHNFTILENFHFKPSCNKTY